MKANSEKYLVQSSVAFEQFGAIPRLTMLIDEFDMALRTVPLSKRRKVVNLIIESYQNVLQHRIKRSSNDDYIRYSISKNGVFMLESCNLVTEEYKEKLLRSYEDANKLSSEEIDRNYQDRLHDSAKKAGNSNSLGLLYIFANMSVVEFDLALVGGHTYEFRFKSLMA